MLPLDTDNKSNKVFDKKITTIILVHNEARFIEATISDFYNKVIKKIPGSEFIVAEDGSTDGTKEILISLNKKIPFILVTGKERKGYERAFKDTMRLAKNELVFFSDSDGQHEPSDFFKLADEIDTNDIVSGYKFRRQDPFHRIAMSKVYNLIFSLLFGLKTRDINSGFKLIRKEVIDKVLDETTNLRFCVMSEFVLRAYLAGYKIKEVPVNHYVRRFGTSNIFKPTKIPFIVFGVIKGLLKIKFS